MPARFFHAGEAKAPVSPEEADGKKVATAAGVSSSFVIVTTGDLPEAYFLAMFLLERSQRVAMVNIIARPMADQLRVLARLRRNRGNRYLADLLLARVDQWLRGRVRRRPGQGAFPEVDAAFMHRVRTEHPHVNCTDPHAEPVLDFVRKVEPDYLLFAGAQIIRPALYEIARHGALNRHLGLLPDFRGSDCPIWAFALQQPECSGYTVHRVVQKVDAGDVLLRRPVAMGGEATLGDYLRRLQREASEGFTAVLDQIIQGKPLYPEPQNSGGRYFPPAGWSTRRRAEKVYRGLTARPLP